jgi:hypothetical protein
LRHTGQVAGWISKVCVSIPCSTRRQLIAWLSIDKPDRSRKNRTFV